MQKLFLTILPIRDKPVIRTQFKVKTDKSCLLPCYSLLRIEPFFHSLHVTSCHSHLMNMDLEMLPKRNAAIVYLWKTETVRYSPHKEFTFRSLAIWPITQH